METLKKEHIPRTQRKQSRESSPGSHHEKYRAGKFPEEAESNWDLKNGVPERVAGLPHIGGAAAALAPTHYVLTGPFSRFREFKNIWTRCQMSSGGTRSPPNSQPAELGGISGGNWLGRGERERSLSGRDTLGTGRTWDVWGAIWLLVVLMMTEEEKMCGDLERARSKHKQARALTRGYSES